MEETYERHWRFDSQQIMQTHQRWETFLTHFNFENASSVGGKLYRKWAYQALQLSGRENRVINKVVSSLSSKDAPQPTIAHAKYKLGASGSRNRPKIIKRIRESFQIWCEDERWIQHVKDMSSLQQCASGGSRKVMMFFIVIFFILPTNVIITSLEFSEIVWSSTIKAL